MVFLDACIPSPQRTVFCFLSSSQLYRRILLTGTKKEKKMQGTKRHNTDMEQQKENEANERQMRANRRTMDTVVDENQEGEEGAEGAQQSQCRSPAGEGGDDDDSGGRHQISPDQEYRKSMMALGLTMTFEQVLGNLKDVMRIEVFPKIKFFRKGNHHDDLLLRHIIESKVGPMVQASGANFGETYGCLKTAAYEVLRSKRSTVLNEIQKVAQGTFGLLLCFG